MQKGNPKKMILTNREIAAEMQKHRNGEYSWKTNLFLFIFSIYAVYLFIPVDEIINFFNNIIIIAVIFFIRDIGYMTGMLIYKYKDPNKFMFPFFKSLVSDYPYDTISFNKGATIILGSLPGMLFAFLTFYLFTIYGIFALQKITIFLVVINTLYLLPIYPLDGGKLLDIIFLKRNMYLSIAIKSLMIILLIASALANSLKIPIIASFLIIMITQNVIRYHLIAKGIETSHSNIKGQKLFQDKGTINETIIKTIRQRITNSYQDVTNIKKISRYIINIYDIISFKSPTIIKRLILICLYTFTLAVMSITVSEYRKAIPYSKTETVMTKEGITRKVYHTYLRKQIIRETEVSDKNLFNGYEKHFDYYTGSVTRTGQWSHGRPDGKWITYSPGGEKIRIITFKNGRFQLWKELINDQWETKQYDQLDDNYKKFFKKIETIEPEGPEKIQIHGF